MSFESIKDLKEDQASYKLLVKGRKSLTNSEILSVIIGGSSEKSKEIAKSLINDTDGNLMTLTRMDFATLKRYAGIGEKSALRILATFELASRRELEKAKTRKKMSCSRDIFALLNPILSDLTYEEFHVMHMNRGNKVLKIDKISEGGFSGTVADPKKIFKSALEHNSSSIVLIHNHPSGNIKPSESDIRLTSKLKKAGSFLDLPVIDHLILGDNTYFSFADEGLL